MTITLPAIEVNATQPGYPGISPNGLPNPAPAPGVIFLIQQQARNPYYA